MARRVDFRANLLVTICVLIYVATNQSSAVDITDCGSTLSNISYSISGCSSDHSSCPFVAGNNVTLLVTFKTDRVIHSSKILIAGHLSFFRVPFSIGPPEACKNWGLKCPTEINSIQNLQITLPIKWYYPRLSVVVELTLLDQEGSKLICLKFPAKIVSSD